MDIDEIRRRMEQRGLKSKDLAPLIGLDAVKLSKSLAGTRRFTAAETDKLRAVLADEGAAGEPTRVIPVLGEVPGGNWRQAIQQPLYSIPAIDRDVPARAFGLRVKGDSMDKLVDDGGTIIVDPDDKALFPGRYYVILNAEGDTTFKQFQSDPARLVPCSTNDLHGDLLIGGQPFEVVGRIIWRSSRM